MHRRFSVSLSVSKINRANFLLHRPPLSKDTIGIGAVTGLARRAQPVRTSKFDYITLSLGKLVRKPIKKTFWRFGLASEAHRFLTGFGRTAKYADTHGDDKNGRLHPNFMFFSERNSLYKNAS